jgi:restriction system protein
MTVWVIRAGRDGEREAWCLENGYAGGGWNDLPSLTDADSREKVRQVVEAAARPDDPVGRRNNNTGQLWGLKSVTPGDIVIMPMKTTKTLAIGRATSGYEYLEDPDPSRRHVVRVDWARDDVPRSAVKDDLLYTLGAIMTIFKASRNEAEARFTRVLEHGVDPGSLTAGQAASTSVSDDPGNHPRPGSYSHLRKLQGTPADRAGGSHPADPRFRL